MKRRTTYNRKRKLIATSPPKHRLEELAQKVTYGGNPEHKRNPGDFNLTPPALPRMDKTLCDGVGIFKRWEAEKLLREGIRKGLISEQCATSGFPQNVWSVTSNGEPLEAQLENAEQGTYHGYPMPASDVFREEILRRW